MTFLKKQSLWSLLILSLALLAVIWVVWWLFTRPAEAPEEGQSLEEIKANIEELNFDSTAIDQELDGFDGELRQLEKELENTAP